jgi:hypothetical protein
MANPGYPMQPPMGGPPMGGGPMGNPMMGPPQSMRPPQPPMRRGAPKAVPVLVSAGLAIGVFCGLLFGLGTGEVEAKANTTEDKKFVGTKIEGADEATTAQGGVGPAPPKSVTDGTLVTGQMTQPKGSAAGSAGSAAGSGDGSAATVAAGSAATVVPTVKFAKLTIALKPDSVKDARILIDGTDIAGMTFDVPLGDKTKKEVLVVVKAPGFKELEQKLEVDEGEMKVEYQLVKARKSSGSVTPKRPPPPGGSGKKKDKKPSGGGLIDI